MTTAAPCLLLEQPPAKVLWWESIYNKGRGALEEGGRSEAEGEGEEEGRGERKEEQERNTQTSKGKGTEEKLPQSPAYYYNILGRKTK